MVRQVFLFLILLWILPCSFAQSTTEARKALFLEVCSEICEGKPGAMLVRNVNFPHPENPQKVVENRKVLIRGGEIKRIRKNWWPMWFVRKGEKVDGHGMYLVPGLTDMHVHEDCRTSSDLLFLVHGVTSLRVVQTIDWEVNTNEYLENHLGLFPRKFRAMPVTDDWALLEKEGAGTNSIGGKTVAEYINGLLDRPEDWVWLNLRLQPNIAEIFLTQAKAKGKKVIAEPAFGSPVTMWVSSEAVASLDNFHGMVSRYFGSGRLEGGEMETIKKWGGYHCPNLIATANFGSYDRFRKKLMDPRYKVADMEDWQAWVSQQGLYAIDYQLDEATLEQFHQMKLDVLQELKAADANFLLGTESGTRAPLVVPGVSLQDEIRIFLENGFSSPEIYEIAILNPPKVLGTEKENGKIKVGYKADLVLLPENPVKDMRAYERVQGVWIDGMYLDDNLLREIKGEFRRNGLKEGL